MKCWITAGDWVQLGGKSPKNHIKKILLRISAKNQPVNSCGDQWKTVCRSQSAKNTLYYRDLTDEEGKPWSLAHWGLMLYWHKASARSSPAPLTSWTKSPWLCVSHRGPVINVSLAVHFPSRLWWWAGGGGEEGEGNRSGSSFCF